MQEKKPKVVEAPKTVMNESIREEVKLNLKSKYA